MNENSPIPLITLGVAARAFFADWKAAPSSYPFVEHKP